MHASATRRPAAIAARLTPAAPFAMEPSLTGILDQPPVRLGPGRMIPGTRYSVVRWLGEGGMGVVYEARHVDIDQRVAVKVLRHRFCGDSEAVRLFRQEARATGQLGSDNIVQVRDFAELPDGRLLIAMEFLEGNDLQATLQRGPLAPSRTIAILRQCCQGLATAHDHGLIHRDIKPENIYLSSEGRRSDKVKLVDFGISMFLDGSVAQTLVGGTPGFLAPEAVLRGEVSPAVDQFALGCVAYAMLAGGPAYSGNTTTEIIEAALSPPRRRPSELCEGIPATLESVVMRCLATEPQGRFSDMRAVEAALCRAQIDAGLSTSWDDLPLPDVDPEERAWILAHMPDPDQGMLHLHRRRRAVALGLSAALAVGSIVATVLVSAGEPVTVQQQSFVEQRVVAARGAAARALFVYPPADAPDTETAYQVVRNLEASAEHYGEDATARAASLREEFAQTLSRLGDDYWSVDGGEVFAVAYYDQAVLFVPRLEPAATRSRLSVARAATLGLRAASSDFSSTELELAEPLAILATSSPGARADQIREYRERRRIRFSSFDRQLDAVAASSENAEESRVSDETVVRSGWPLPPASQDRVEKPDSARAAEPVTTHKDPARTAGTVEGPRRSKTAATAAVRKAVAALRRGDEDGAEALFERALAADPANTKALCGLRDVHFDRGNHSQAVRYGKKVVRLSPKRSQHRLRLGDAYFKTGRYDLAQEQYKEAARLGSSDAGWRLEKNGKRLD